MNFDFTEKEKTFFEHLEREMADFGADDNPNRGQMEAAHGCTAEGLACLFKTGYLNLGLEKGSSGFGGSLTHMRAREILAGISPSLYLSVEMGTQLFGKIIDCWGTRTQKKRILPDLKRGKLLGAVAVSENSINVENDPLATTGQPADGGAVRINGSKSNVVNAPDADHIAVAGRLDDRDALFLVKKDAPGLTIGELKRPMGYENTVTADIRLSSCAVDAADVIDDFGGDNLLDTLKFWENQILVGASLGLMKSSLETAKHHSENHITGGKPVKAYQAVGFKLAEMLAMRQTSQLLAYRAAWSADCDKKSCADLTLCAKVFCSEAAEWVSSQALQVLSGRGFFSPNRAASAFQCSKYGQIAGVSSEIARVKLGDQALGYRA